MPSNCQLRTCLSTTWKLLSGIIAAKVRRHMDQYISRAQKRIGSNTREAKNPLLADRAAACDYKFRSTNLCAALIDCKKAYDSMSHTWILE